MGKYIGPKTRIARRFGEAIYGADKSLDKRNVPPGQHGLARKRKKVTEYGVQLTEKQNMIFIFENGKAVRVPMSEYATQGARKKLKKAYSDASKIVKII